MSSVNRAQTLCSRTSLLLVFKLQKPLVLSEHQKTTAPSSWQKFPSCMVHERRGALAQCCDGGCRRIQWTGVGMPCTQPTHSTTCLLRRTLIATFCYSAVDCGQWLHVVCKCFWDFCLFLQVEILWNRIVEQFTV